jgi:hypothetical protein
MVHYHNTFALFLDEMPMDEASKEVRGTYDACVEARKQLVMHEREHECIPTPQMISAKENAKFPDNLNRRHGTNNRV